MMMKKYLCLNFGLVFLYACSTPAVPPTVNYFSFDKLSPIERVALCQQDDEAINLRKEIVAEHGFKKSTKHSYRPVVESTVFGHKVRLVAIKDDMIRFYVAGEPDELAHHTKFFLPDLDCQKDSCTYNYKQGKETGNRFVINKTASNTIKDTTLLECHITKTK